MLVFYLVQHLHHHCIFASLCSIARDKVVKREFLWQRIPRGSSRKISWLRRAGPRFLCRAEFVRSPRGKRVEARSCGPAIQAHQIHRVRLAEWSKAPDLSSGSRERAWVRTPHLTIQSFAPSFRLRRALISVQFPILRAGRACVVVAPRCDAHLDAFIGVRRDQTKRRHIHHRPHWQIMPFWRNSRWKILFSNISWGEGMRWLMNEDIFCQKPILVLRFPICWRHLLFTINFYPVVTGVL